jgi:uncharacterized protein YbjT (DUF2867 family)
MRGKLVTVFGGTGFLGSYLVPKLVELGAMVRVVGRNPDSALALKMSGEVGLVQIVSVDYSKKESVKRAIGDSDYVVNLTGIIVEPKGTGFQKVHVDVAKAIAHACATGQVSRLVHMSAIGADPKAEARYLASKGKGEIEVLKTFPDVTILRPSIIFGAEDNFFNLFGVMAVTAPFLPLIAGGKMRMQPVYVGDVAEAICLVLKDGKNNPYAGKTYELGGPGVYSFRELMSYVLQETRRKRMLLYIPYPIALAMGTVMQLFPSPTLTRDQVKLIKKDNVVASEALTFKDLGLEPMALEAVVPEYLSRYRFHG